MRPSRGVGIHVVALAIRHAFRGLAVGLTGLATLVAPALAADDLEVTGPSDPEAQEEPAPEVGNEVELDQLLQLPSSMSFGNETRNGASANEWRARFRTSFKELQAAQDALAETKQALDEVATTGGGGQWQMAPPGSNNTEVTPMNFKLREDLRTGRERLEEAESKHRALVIQADLAGVPEAWRQPE